MQFESHLVYLYLLKEIANRTYRIDRDENVYKTLIFFLKNLLKIYSDCSQTPVT